jgi:predicted MFS family arabinose efflux permease
MSLKRAAIVQHQMFPEGGQRFQPQFSRSGSDARCRAGQFFLPAQNRTPKMFNQPLNRWWTVAGGALGVAVGIGVLGNSFGIFTNAIGKEFGWDRSTTTLGLTIEHVCAGISYIPMSFLMVRWGVRGPTAVTIALCAASIFCMGLVPNSPAIYYFLFAFMGICSGASNSIPYSIAIVRSFDAQRGLALGLMVTGTGIGATLIPLYTNYMMANYGWRGGFMGIGILVAVVTLPALAFMVRVPPPTPQRREQIGETEGVPAFLDIITLPRFWLIGAPIFFLSMAVIGTLGNIVPVMTDKGFSTANAVGMLSVAGFASLFSRAFVGLLLDKFHASVVAAGSMGISILGLLVLLAVPVSTPVAYLIAVLIGFSLGSEADIITYMVSRYFSPASYTKVVSAVFILFATGNGTGVSVYSYSLDYLGSYRPGIELLIALLAVGIALVLRLGEYPLREQHVGNHVGEDDLSPEKVPAMP